MQVLVTLSDTLLQGCNIAQGPSACVCVCVCVGGEEGSSKATGPVRSDDSLEIHHQTY